MQSKPWIDGSYFPFFCIYSSINLLIVCCYFWTSLISFLIAFYCFFAAFTSCFRSKEKLQVLLFSMWNGLMLTYHNSDISMTRQICFGFRSLYSCIFSGKRKDFTFASYLILFYFYLILYEKYSKCRKVLLCHY